MDNTEVFLTRIIRTQNIILPPIIIFKECKGMRCLPIPITMDEIPIFFQKTPSYQNSRPPSYFYLLCNVITNNKLIVKNVQIYKLKRNTYYAHIRILRENEMTIMESNVGVAAALSMHFSTKIYVSSEIMNTASISLTESQKLHHKDDITLDNDVKDDNTIGTEKNEHTLKKLSSQLKNAITKEEYELAAQLRDKINQLKS